MLVWDITFQAVLVLTVCTVKPKKNKGINSKSTQQLSAAQHPYGLLHGVTLQRYAVTATEPTAQLQVLI
jgi:hypothetical protein